jgi:hypothetical protein
MHGSIPVVAVGDQDLVDPAVVERGDLARRGRVGGLGPGDRVGPRVDISLNSAAIASASVGVPTAGSLSVGPRTSRITAGSARG